MKTSPPNGNELERLKKPCGNVLVFIAHQDDEVFIASRIKQHINLGDNVFIVWMTQSQHRGEKYGEKRIAESRNVIKLLGVPSKNCTYLGFTDGRSYKRIPEIIVALKGQITDNSPDIIYTHTLEYGHVDHDVSGFCVDSALKEMNLDIPVYEFPVYSAYNLNRSIPYKMRNIPSEGGFKTRILDEEEFKFVSGLWNNYKSQRFSLVHYLILFFGRRNTFGKEYLKKSSGYDYTTLRQGYRSGFRRFTKRNKVGVFGEAVKQYIS